ncbi:MAG: hypothetical protein Q8R35_01450 [bacterium]|nr:hypothetical protein [bacterium]
MEKVCSRSRTEQDADRAIKEEPAGSEQHGDEEKRIVKDISMAVHPLINPSAGSEEPHRYIKIGSKRSGCSEQGEDYFWLTAGGHTDTDREKKADPDIKEHMRPPIC